MRSEHNCAGFMGIAYIEWNWFQARLEVVDLFVDFGDGVLLMKLLEIISGEKLGKPNR